jgi:glycosyltransferase involved in cell wall biosynthesis
MDQAAPVHFIYDLFPDADMPRLFAAATHYISLSFGEGWDLSMAEAAATGLRLIAPAHSGYLAYLDQDVACMVPAREVPVVTAAGSWMNELFRGASWWAPDAAVAAGLIRRAIEGDDVPRLSARERMQRRFTWEAATDQLIESLDEAEVTAGV